MWNRMTPRGFPPDHRNYLAPTDGACAVGTEKRYIVGLMLMSAPGGGGLVVSVAHLRGLTVFRVDTASQSVFMRGWSVTPPVMLRPPNVCGVERTPPKYPLSPSSLAWNSDFSSDKAKCLLSTTWGTKRTRSGVRTGSIPSLHPSIPSRAQSSRAHWLRLQAVSLFTEEGINSNDRGSSDRRITSRHKILPALLQRPCECCRVNRLRQVLAQKCRNARGGMATSLCFVFGSLDQGNGEM